MRSPSLRPPTPPPTSNPFCFSRAPSSLINYSFLFSSRLVQNQLSALGFHIPLPCFAYSPPPGFSLPCFFFEIICEASFFTLVSSLFFPMSKKKIFSSFPFSLCKFFFVLSHCTPFTLISTFIIHPFALLTI